MALPAFATKEQLSARIPGGLPAAENDRADAALEDASALIRAEAGKTWVTNDVLDTDLPDVIFVVTIAVARRVLSNPDGVASETVPDYARTFPTSSTSADVYLTRAEKRAVRRAAGKSGLWTQATTRVDADGDVPAITGQYVTSPVAGEEYDPFAEGWPV